MITLSNDELKAVFLKWATDEVNGNCISQAEYDNMSVQEKSEAQAEDFINYLAQVQS